jgi:hypothetical protein
LVENSLGLIVAAMKEIRGVVEMIENKLEVIDPVE